MDDPQLTMAQIERIEILDRLAEFHGNKSSTARSLGWSRETLYRKIEKYGIDVGKTEGD